MKKLAKYQGAKELYEKGLSIQDIATSFKISRQAMWSILKRRGCKMRSKLRYKETNHFYRGTKAYDPAQNLLERAIKKGIVIRKTHCEICLEVKIFKNGRTGIQAHHSDYNKPLDVMWLCQKCHHQWDKQNKAIKYTQSNK